MVKIHKNSKGSALTFILVMMVFITAASALIFQLVLNNRHQAVLQSENIKLYYLTKAGLDVTLESLINERGALIINDFQNKDPKMIVHDLKFDYNDGTNLGRCEITVKRVIKDKKPWVEIIGKTYMRDIRNSGYMVKTGKVSVSVKNPLIREYSIENN